MSQPAPVPPLPRSGKKTLSELQAEARDRAEKRMTPRIAVTLGDQKVSFALPEDPKPLPVHPPEREDIPKSPPRPAPKAKARRVRVKTETLDDRPYMKVGGWSLLYVLAGLAVMFMIVHSSMKLTDISGEHTHAQNELTSLRKEYVQILADADSDLPIETVERDAIAELGMVKPGAEQIIYIDLAKPEEGVVSKTATFWEDLSAKISGFAERVKEFVD